MPNFKEKQSTWKKIILETIEAVLKILNKRPRTWHQHVVSAI